MALDSSGQTTGQKLAAIVSLANKHNALLDTGDYHYPLPQRLVRGLLGFLATDALLVTTSLVMAVVGLDWCWVAWQGRRRAEPPPSGARRLFLLGVGLCLGLAVAAHGSGLGEPYSQCPPIWGPAGAVMALWAALLGERVLLASRWSARAGSLVCALCLALAGVNLCFLLPGYFFTQKPYARTPISNCTMPWKVTWRGYVHRSCCSCQAWARLATEA